MLRMAKKKSSMDPLESIDPVVEQSFSDFLLDEKEVGSDDEEQSSDKDSLKWQSTLDEDMDPSRMDISEVQFPPLQKEVSGKKVDLDVFGNIPVHLSVELGRSQISLKEVFELTEGSIIELNRLAGEPLDLVVNGQVIAQGEVVAIDHNYGLRVTHITSRL